MTISIGDKLPKLTVATTGDEKLSLPSLKGQNLVIYFYPKDHTPGCTTEGQNFRDAYKQFQKMNTEILGVSRESLKSHRNFINKHGFPFYLISDPEEELCQAFDVIKEKKLYGRVYMGIERSTFIFDSKGKLRHALRKIKVKGHVDEVLQLVADL